MSFRALRVVCLVLASGLTFSAWGWLLRSQQCWGTWTGDDSFGLAVLALPLAACFCLLGRVLNSQSHASATTAGGKGGRHHPRSMETILGLLLGGTLLWTVVIAVPNQISARGKNRGPDSVVTAHAIRAAFASFAADSPSGLFPPTVAMASYPDLVRLVEAQGGTLPARDAKADVQHARRIMQRMWWKMGGCQGRLRMPITFVDYISTNETGYTLTLQEEDAPQGWQTLVVTPEGITTR